MLVLLTNQGTLLKAAGVAEC